jgi:hypothetical protein
MDSGILPDRFSDRIITDAKKCSVAASCASMALWNHLARAVYPKLTNGF